MRCADDPPGALDERVATRRAADLCRAAEEVWRGRESGAPAPVYVIGTEVPIPGGELAEAAGPDLTRVEDVERTMTLTHEAFERAGLIAAWERVIALVV